MSGRVRTLADLGESALIARIARRAGHPVGTRWALGIGDDAAILRTRADEDLVFSTDALVERVHFRFEREPPHVVGRRALAVNLSDLAAMGAEPVGALLSLAAPRDLPLRRFDALIAGFVAEGERFGCPLVGGNLSRAESCHLDVTVIGRCRRGGALRRSGLRPGDQLFVTGTLGGAALARLRADSRGGALRRVPIPRLAAGRALARIQATRACIDLSDGLATDLGHLLAADRLGAEIALSDLPRPRSFGSGCRALGLDPDRVLVGGGEDYELLFALRPRNGGFTPRFLTRRLDVEVSAIGHVVSRPGIRGLPEPSEGHHF